MVEATRRITGTSLPEAAFRIRETDKALDVSAVFEVLGGALAAYRVRGYVPLDACRRIAENFWSSEARAPRYGDGEDGVEAYLIGASHYGKPTLQYLAEARAWEPAVKSLYAGTINPVSAFREALVSGSGGRLRARPAELNGLRAGDSKAVYWNNNGRFLLEPHDDLAQVKDPIQKDFEIQQAARVMALNIYAEVPVNSGQVQIWNVEPDDRTRDELGLSNVGFPYPAEPLDGYQSMIIPVETGDLCLFNGNLVHAVLRGDTTSQRNRLLITCFMAINRSGELIWWT